MPVANSNFIPALHFFLNQNCIFFSCSVVLHYREVALMTFNCSARLSGVNFKTKTIIKTNQRETFKKW